MDRKLPEKVDDLARATRQGEPQNKRRKENGEYFGEEDGELHLEQLTKFGMHLRNTTKSQRGRQSQEHRRFGLTDFE